MKLVIAALITGSAAAFAPQSSSRANTALNVDFNVENQALPGKFGPATLDGSLAGDVGFDPVGFSTAPFAKLFDSEAEDTMTDLQWLREAELAHGRIAQLAVLGFIVPSTIGTFPGNEWSGVDAYSFTNPLEALDHAPGFAIFQILVFLAWVELNRVQLIGEQGSSRVPGDIKLGTADGWNPFNLDYSPEELRVKQTQEIKHCRLAMLGAFGLFCQAANSGKDIADQLGSAFTSPEYYAKAGYFFSEGI